MTSIVSSCAPRGRTRRWGQVLLAGWVVLILGGVIRSEGAPQFHRNGVPYAIDVWRNDDDLPRNSVITIVQSREGYLWLGTVNGLVRFDGHQFTVLDQYTTPDLPSNRIVGLFEDREGQLWVSTEDAGVVLIREGRVLPLDLGRTAEEGRVVDMCQDASGAIWLLTLRGTLARHRDGHLEVWSVGDARSGVARSVIPRAAGSVWVGSEWSLLGVGQTEPLRRKDLPVEHAFPMSRLDRLVSSPSGGHWRLTGLRVQRWSESGLTRDFGRYGWGGAGVSAACEDGDGNLVVGTLGEGVYWYDEGGRATRLSKEEGLSRDYILSLLLDRENNLWIGTDGGGLVRVKRQDFDRLEAAQEQVVQSVCEAPNGTLWVGFNGGGLLRHQDGQAVKVPLRQGSLEPSVRAVLADRDGTVWAGTWGWGLFRQGTNGFARVPGWERLSPIIHALHEDASGRLWVGTAGGLVRREDEGWELFTVEQGMSGNAVRALADDRHGGLWIGTEGGGVCRLKDGRFECWHQADGAPSDEVSSLWVDEGGTVWVTTTGRGLGRFDGAEWVRYTRREGLVSNSLGYIVGDDQGFLWIGSNAGLMRVAKAQLDAVVEGRRERVEARVYRLGDGLPTRECTEGSQPGTWRGQDGRFWFSTTDGLASVDPAALQPNPHPPAVVIEAVEVDGQPQRTNLLQTTWSGPIVVPPERERIEIHYTSLNLRAPDRAQFQFRMAGHELGWTEAGDSRVARYSKLPPGDYEFQVRASNEDGLWNLEGGRLAFLVQPPFWRTWWFLSGVSAGLLGLVVGVVYVLSTQRLQRQVERLRQQQALERERGRIARDLHDQLGASLTQISLLGEMAEADKGLPEEVEAHARQISQTSRDTTRVLDEIVWAVNPSNDTLDGLITYFCKNAQEYLTVAGVRCRLEVPSVLPSTNLPPDVRHNVFLASKEAVTNIVRHAQASEAHIRLWLEPRRFTLVIQDNGKGLGTLNSEAAARRNGLRNMRKRMEDIGGEFALESGPGGVGVMARLIVPLNPGR